VTFSARFAGLVCLLLCSSLADAGGFSAMVSPPRFEDVAKPGTTWRNVVEITNVSTQSAHFAFKTADWQLDAQGAAVFSDTLAPGSCRPWVGIEAPEITIPTNGRRRYRFEVAIPANAPAGECRFALMMDGDPEVVPGSTSLPVAGRLGIIVYLQLGDAAPMLQLVGSHARSVQGRVVPVLQVRNSGNAHGRLDGFIEGRDGSGHKIVLTPAGLPILPGETRDIPLTSEADNSHAAVPTIVWPLHLKGRLDWGSQHLDLDTTILDTTVAQ
jgi:hypothetical protein